MFVASSFFTREFKMGAQTMPTLESALHLGIIRTTSLKDTMIKNVEGNIKKTRRSAYGLFGGRYHGNNGLDPDTLIHLFLCVFVPLLIVFRRVHTLQRLLFSLVRRVFVLAFFSEIVLVVSEV
jgi:hypothetical protein